MNRQKLQEFNADPFSYVDKINLTFKGLNFNLFQKYKATRKTALYGAMFCLVCWIVFGWDSTPLQFLNTLYGGVPGFLQGTKNLQDLVVMYHTNYGKEMHYSAFVTYFLLFYFMSRSWETAGVEKTKNMVFSFAGMFLSIAVFEWFWIYSFGVFQSQPWVYTWQFPQARILIQNGMFTLVGCLTALYMLTERWHWNGRIQGERSYYFDARSWKLWFMIGVSVAAALFWIIYPGYINQINVVMADGSVWQSSRLFPQTLYTVDLTPFDAENAGVWFWIQDDAIHAVNVVVKLLWAATSYYVFKVKKVES